MAGGEHEDQDVTSTRPEGSAHEVSRSHADWFSWPTGLPTHGKADLHGKRCR